MSRTPTPPMKLPPFRSLTPPGARWKGVHSLVRNPASLLGLAIVLAFLVVAVFAPVLAPSPESAYETPAGGERLRPPTSMNWFGTDSLGRDIFSRVVMGARISLRIILLTVTFAAITGVLLGTMAGYRTRGVDDLIMRLTDIFLSVPSLILAMLVATTLGGGIENTIIAIAVTWWPRYARLARGETLRLRSALFVEAARAVGASEGRIIRRHLLPNMMPLVIVQASLDSGQAILTAAALGFIGLGAKPPTPEWGLMVAIGREWLPTFWWLSAFPGLVIFVIVLGLNLLGDGLLTVLDPRLRPSTG